MQSPPMTVEEFDALPPEAIVWVVSPRRHPEESKPWQTSRGDGRIVRHSMCIGEWAVYPTEAAAYRWHYDRVASWAHAEIARLQRVARKAKADLKRLSERCPETP